MHLDVLMIVLYEAFVSDLPKNPNLNRVMAALLQMLMLI
jgi:hypothetical protein